MKKKMKIILPGILLVVLTAAVLAAAWGMLNLGRTDKTEGVTRAEANDEETLRQLLLEESDYEITVNQDMEVDKQFIVKGEKTLTGDGELRMALHAEWGQALLMLSENASLTMDGLVLDGNYVADGIHMEKSAELTYLSGTIRRTDSYGIWAQGKVTVKDITIDSADYIAVFAQKGSELDIEGGTLSKSATNDVYVEKGATVNITGAPVMEACMGDAALLNYGTLNVSGGTYTGANGYTFNNFGDLTVISEGDEIQCSGSRLGVVCTRKGANTTLKGVHIYDTKAQAVVTVGGKTSITDCTFEKTGYHSIEIQTGKANIENVTIKDSQNAGIESYTDAVVAIDGLQVEGCEGIGISSRGAAITGNDIKITGAKKYGVACGNSKNGKASAVIRNATVTDTEQSSFYVYEDASMELENVQASDTRSRGIYVAKGASCILSGESTIQNAEFRGVEVRSTFVMNDGEIFDNKVENSGAGVYVAEKGDFTMNGGKIYDNASELRGGGICVTDDGKVTIKDGDVYNNTAENNGGGLYAQKNAVIQLTGGSIRNNRSEAYGDGVYVASAETKVMLGDQFYAGKNDIKIDNVETSLQITGSRLAKHSASDPLLLTPNYNAKEGTVVASCKNESIAKALAVKVGPGDRSYNIIQDNKNYAITYATADMDMTGADTVYVSTFDELKAAVINMRAGAKRYIVLQANIAMEERIRFPGGVTIAIKDDGTPRMITRSTGYEGNLFVTHYGTGLILEATVPGNLVLDGTHSADVDGKTVQSLVRTAGSTVFRNVTLQNNGVLDKDSKVRGALFRQLYGDFRIYNSVLRNGCCSSGGALMLDKGTGYIEGSSFAGNQSVIGGGALRAAENTDLEIRDSAFSGNKAGTAGGAFVAVGGAKVTVANTQFTDNTAQKYGGALSVQDDGTVLILEGTDSDSAVFANNSAATIGAVCAHMGARLEVSGYTFKNNKATDSRAGALGVNSGATACLENTAFYKNQAEGSGGALSIDESSVEVISCEFGKKNAGNIAKDKGGAILVTGDGSLIMDVSRGGKYHGLAYNQAVIGGAICVYGGEAEISHYTLQGNKAKQGGGAIHILDGSKVACDNSSFVENTSPGNGGAVHCTGTYVDKNSTYTKNTGKNGGALIVMSDGKAVLKGSSQSALFKDNTASGNGGAVFVNISGTLETDGYQFESNHAKMGGAVYAQENASSVAITGAVMKANEAKRGGAVYANGRGLVITGSKFEENRAVDETETAGIDGGAIYANTDSEITIARCEFTKNEGQTGGGAIHILQGATVTCEDSAFTENTSPGNGGAVHCKGTYVDTNSTYTKNTGRNGGAIIAINGGIVTLTGTDGRFVDNQASVAGNAIFIQFDESQATVSGYAFEGDTPQTVQVNGSLTFDNITGATLVRGKDGTLYLAGYQAGNEVTIVLDKDSYIDGSVVLLRADTMSEEEFEAACKEIIIAPDPDGGECSLSEEGTLNGGRVIEYVARIEGGAQYETLEEAVAAAADNDVIYVLDNATISKQITINKKITITNEPGQEVTIGRNADKLMFSVSSGAKLMLGSNSDEGNLIVDGAIEGTCTTRIVNNNAGAEFVLGKNAILQNANNNQWGSALINSGTAELHGTVKGNTCSGAGGAILQNDGKLTIVEGTYTGNTSTRKASGKTTASYGGAVRVEKGTLEIKGGTFSNNSTTGLGGAVWVNEGAALILSGGTFSGNTAAGKASDIYSNTPVEIAGSISGTVNFTPSVYELEKEVLRKGADVSDEQFQAVCEGITVTKDASGRTWTIDEAGKLQTSYEARIGGSPYNTLQAAFEEAKINGGTIYVNNDVKINEQFTVAKEITITNEPGKEVTITRVANVLMFDVSSGAKLTLGTNDEDSGQLIVDGGGKVVSSQRIVNNRSEAQFVLGKNATLQNADNNQWGSALCNRGTAELHGTVKNNTSRDGGAILQYDGKLIIVEGTYTGNKSTNYGGAIRVQGGTLEIKGGTFSDNTTTGDGGAVYVNANTTVTITGGTFTRNTADGKGNAVYIAKDGSVTVEGGKFDKEEPKQSIYVVGTLKHNGLLDGLTEGEGTIEVPAAAEASEGPEAILAPPQQSEAGAEAAAPTDTPKEDDAQQGEAGAEAAVPTDTPKEDDAQQSEIVPEEAVPLGPPDGTPQGEGGSEESPSPDAVNPEDASQGEGVPEKSPSPDAMKPEDTQQGEIVPEEAPSPDAAKPEDAPQSESGTEKKESPADESEPLAEEHTGTDGQGGEQP